MATFYLIRHGKPDYTYGDTHGFIGQGHDFAPLKEDGIKDVIETSKDTRLKNAQIIVASPYTGSFMAYIALPRMRRSEPLPFFIGWLRARVM